MIYIPEGIKLVIFDWDGTVVDSVEPKLLQNQAIAEEFGNHIGIEQVRVDWNESAGFPDLLSRLTKGAPFDEVMKVVNRDYRDPRYAKRRFDFSVEEVIQGFRNHGIQTGLLTNATETILSKDSTDLNISLDLFDHIQTVEMCESKKPDPRVLVPLLGKFGVNAGETLYIGDEMKDYLLTQNAGAHFIGVGTGMSSQEDFERAGAIYAPTLKEVQMYGTV